MDGERHRLVDAVDRGKADLAVLLAGGVHGGGGRGRELLDRPIGVPDGVHHAFAGRDPGQLMRRGGERHLDLPEPDSRAGCRATIVLISSPRPAKRPRLLKTLPLPLQKNTSASVGSSWRCAQSFSRCSRAMVGEVAVDDAVLEHAAERQREAAGRPGEPAGDDVVGADAASPRRAPARRCRARCPTRRRSGDTTTPARRRRAAPGSTAKVALWVATAKAISATSALRSQRRSAPSAKTRRCTASTARPAKMSVSRMLVSHGSVVRPDSAAVTPSSSSGRPPKPSARSSSASTQTVSAAWTHDHRPEIGMREDVEEEAEHRRAARHQIAFEPAHQIAAGVVLQQRKPVPDRRREQNEGARHGGTDTRYARHPESPVLHRHPRVILAARDERWLKKSRGRVRHFVPKAVDRTVRNSRIVALQNGS